MVRKDRLTAVLLALVMLVTGAAAEVQFLPHIGAWTAAETPLRLKVTCEVISEASSGEQRLEQLNAMMQHLSLQIDVQQLQDETWSRTAVMVNDAPAVTVSLRRTPRETVLQSSCLPDETLLLPPDAVDPISLVTGAATEDFSFYGMDASGAVWLKDAEALLGKLATLLEPWGSAKKVDTSIKNMGKAKTKTTYTVPAEEAAGLAKLLSGACNDGELKTLLGKMMFEGKQQFIIYQNAAGAIIKLTYEGKCGVEASSMRNAELSWSLRRDDDNTRDTFTLKTPAVKGSNRNNVTFSRVAKKNKSGTVTIDLSGKVEQVVDKQMTSWACEADLKVADARDGVKLTGDFTLKHTTPDDVTRTLTLSPALTLGEEKPAASGAVTVKKTRAGNTEIEAKLGITLGEGEYFNWDLSNTELMAADMTDADVRQMQERIAANAATALVRRIALLPEEATLYLFDGIDETVRAQIIEISRKALEEEEAR